MTTTSNRSDHDASRDDDNNAHGYNTDNSGRDSNTLAWCYLTSPPTEFVQWERQTTLHTLTLTLSSQRRL